MDKKRRDGESKEDHKRRLEGLLINREQEADELRAIIAAMTPEATEEQTQAAEDTTCSSSMTPFECLTAQSGSGPCAAAQEPLSSSSAVVDAWGGSAPAMEDAAYVAAAFADATATDWEEEADDAEETEHEDDDEEMRQDEVLSFAREKADQAIMSIREAMAVMEAPVDDLEEACEQIQVVENGPPAHGAVQALHLVSRVLQSQPSDKAAAILKEVERMVRDVVVLRCKYLCQNPKDREEFLKVAAQAYGDALDSPSHKEIRAQLLLAYHKDPKNKDGFISNNQVAAMRRGGPRPRRRRNAAKDRQPAASQVPTPQAPDPADAAAGAPAPPPPPSKPKRSRSRRSPVRGPARALSAPRHLPPRSSLPRPAKKPGLVTPSSGPSGSKYRSPTSQSMPRNAYLPSSAACVPYHNGSSCLPYTSSSSCLPYHAPYQHNWGNASLYERNMYTNGYVNGYPTPMMEMPAASWDYRMTTSTNLQNNRPWQVLVLLEFNHLLVHTDLEALEDSSWGIAIEFHYGGYRMYIRPGATDFVRCLLEETRRSCTLGIFTGLSPKMAVPMVQELFKQSIDWEWKAEHDIGMPPCVVGKDGAVRVYIFERSEEEDPDNEIWPPESRLPELLQLQHFHADVSKVWQTVNDEDNHFDKQNTVLVGLERERRLCPDNVLCASLWSWQEDGNYMKHMRDRIATLFHEQPDHVTTWLRPGFQLHNI